MKGGDRRGRSTTPASSAATRWPAASSTASTAPTPTMFDGAVWVLTPGAAHRRRDVRRGRRRSSPSSAPRWSPCPPSATTRWSPSVSHVPHLTAATLMGLAADRAEEHAALLRLAAGGFRDMTRIASGHPGIWLDICAENRAAILVGARRADRRAGGDARRSSTHDDRAALLDRLQPGPRRAHQPAEPGHPARASWPRCASRSPTAPGAAAEVFTLAAELGVNIASFEVVHIAEGNRGVAVVLVDAADGRPVPRRPDRPRLPPGRAAAELTPARVRVRTARAGRSTRSSPCPARRASPTGRWSCAALADGTSRRSRGVPDGDDTAAMLDCLDAARRRRRRSSGDDAVVDVGGTGGVLAARPRRRSTPASPARRRASSPRWPRSAPGRSRVDGAAAAAAPADGAAARRARRARRDGRARRARGATCRSTVARPAARGGDGRPCPATCRSQYVTALMLIGPHLAGGLRLRLTTPLVSRAVPRDHRGGDGRVRRRRRRRSASDEVARRRRAGTAPASYAIEPDASLGELPAGGRRGLRRPGDGRRARRRRRCRATRAFADLLAAMGCTRRRATPTAPTVDARRRAAARHRRRHGRHVRPRADARRRRRVARPRRRTIRGVGFIRGKESDRLGDLCAELRRAGVDAPSSRRRTAHRARPAAPRRRASAPTTTTAWRWPSPCSALAFDGHRGRRSRRRLEELARLLGRCSTHALAAVSIRPRVVAAFDVDGTLTRRDCVVPFLVRVGRPPAASSPALAAPPARRRRPRSPAATATRSRRSSPAACSRGRSVGRRRAARRRVRRRRRRRLAARRRRRPAALAPARAATRSCSCRRRSAPYLRPLAALLGVDGVLCTDVGRRRRPLHRRPLDGGNCRGAEKVGRLARLARRARAACAPPSCGPTATRRRRARCWRRRRHPVWVEPARSSPPCPRSAAVMLRAAAPRGAPEAVGQERARVRRARRRRRARPSGDALGRTIVAVRRLLPRRERHLLLERHPRRRGRPAAPDEAAPPDRRRRSAGRHGAGRRHAACSSSASALAARPGAGRRCAVVAGYVVLDADLQRWSEARRRDRPRSPSPAASCCGPSPAPWPSTCRCRTWFVLCTSFGSLFIVTGKRYAELREIGEDAAACAGDARRVLARLPAHRARRQPAARRWSPTASGRSRPPASSRRRLPFYELSIVPMLDRPAALPAGARAGPRRRAGGGLRSPTACCRCSA